MPIKVLVNGAFGRMGQMTAKTIAENPAFELVGEAGRDYHLQQAIVDTGADVVIDFTHPDVVYQNSLTIIDAGAKPIIGTSGLTLDQIKTLQERCRSLKRGGIIAPNFSLGAVLMMKYAKEIVKYMPHVEIIEMHHHNKADSPSGTAMRTAQMLVESNSNVNTPPIQSIENVTGARGAHYQQIPIHSIRLPGLLAHQQIIFGNAGETLTLQHNSIDRLCFMPGVSLAVVKVMELSELVYGLENVL